MTGWPGLWSTPSSATLAGWRWLAAPRRPCSGPLGRPGCRSGRRPSPTVGTGLTGRSFLGQSPARSSRIPARWRPRSGGWSGTAKWRRMTGVAFGWRLKPCAFTAIRPAPPAWRGKWAPTTGSHSYRFLGIADANTYTWVESYGSRQLTGVPMVDASYPFGDVLALYMDHWLPADSLQSAIDWIAQDAGFPILTTTTAVQLAPAQLRGLHRVFGLEVYDGRLSLMAATQADATQQWDQLLTAGARV